MIFHAQFNIFSEIGNQFTYLARVFNFFLEFELQMILVKEVNSLHFSVSNGASNGGKVALQPLPTNTSHLIIGLCQELVEVEQQVATSLPFRQA